MAQELHFILRPDVGGVRRRMKERHLAELAERFEHGQDHGLMRGLAVGARQSDIFHHFAFTFGNDPQMPAQLALADDHRSGRRLLHLNDLGQLPPFGRVQIAEQRNIAQQRFGD